MQSLFEVVVLRIIKLSFSIISLFQCTLILIYSILNRRKKESENKLWK